MKYIDWLFQWLENYVRLSVKTRTYERYKLIVEQHISQEIGDVALDCLSLQKVFSRFQSPATTGGAGLL